MARRDRAQAQLAVVARERVSEQFAIIAHGRVGEPSNGALLLRMAAVIDGGAKRAELHTPKREPRTGKA